jgi:hypothetical protein
MTLQDEKKWRDLCRQAINENDLNKLMKLYCALDRATEKDRQTEITADVVRVNRGIDPGGQTVTG